MVDSLALQSVTLGASNIPDHDPSWVFCSTLVLQGLTGLGQDGGGHSSKTEVQARVCRVHYHISLDRCRGEGGEGGYSTDGHMPSNYTSAMTKTLVFSHISMELGVGVGGGRQMTGDWQA